MFQAKKISLFLSLILITFFVSGCVVTTTSQQTVANNMGGIYLSIDKGTTWKSKSLIPTTNGKPASFSGLDAASLVMDPSDSKAVYFGSVGNGLYYTYNGGETWQIASGLGNATIRAIDIDPGNKCTIYVAIANAVYRSTDCSRTWSQVYLDSPTVTVDSVAVDHYNSSVIYISVSRGDLIRSEDGATSWQTIYRAKDKIIKVVIDPSDSRAMYVATEKNGIFYSKDSGEKWSDFNKTLREQQLGLSVRDVALAKSDSKIIYIATSYGMLRSKDGGDTWDKIELIPPEKQAAINAMAINANNSDEVYYVTNTTFYRSLDGGKSWTPIKLPTSRAGAKLLVNPQSPNIVYMAFKTIAK